VALAWLAANPLPRILPVEENEMNRDLLSRRLVRSRHDVSIATDGKQAIDKALAGARVCARLPKAHSYDSALPARHVCLDLEDPFERMNWPSHGVAEGSIAYWDVFKHEMWRFQIPAQIIAKYVPTLVEYPPMQAGASFKFGGLKERVEQAIAAAKGNAE
jgi:CheY-like chemotaxis protein